jgi:PAS domain S-box-containing protein
LFIRSPQHRWPVAICLLAQVVARAAFILDQFPAHVVPRVDASAFAFSISSALYVVALFGYRMFDPVHLARSSAVRQMREGMLVLDGDFRIAESNPAAQSLLRQSASQLKGRPIEEVLPGCESLRQRVSDAAGAAGRVEICLPSNPSERYHSLRLLPLEDQPGHVIGHLLLIEDITEARQAQARLLEQQRALAALQERTRLARELHDNAGQILGYVSLQAQAVRKWVQDGDTARAETQLDRLASIAQQGHAELREAIFSLKAGGSEPWSFFTTLRHYLETYHTHYGIRTELTVPAGLGDAAFPPEEGVQLLRVIQEALTNAHRHGGARNIRLSFERQDGVAHIQIDDDGCGFDPQALPGAPGEHYGLAFMRERMQQIGGSLSIDSQPGTGTQLTLLAPLAQ